MNELALTAKTDRQALLEVQHGKPVKDILLESLAKHRGQRNMTMLVGIELSVSNATIYNWCDQLGIDIAGYRRPSDAVSPGQEAE